jgi:hypothetical protein
VSTELQRLIEDASGMVDTFFEPEGQMMAHILSIDAAGERVLMACQMADATEERMFRIGVPMRLKAAGHRRWVFFTEAWTASYGAEQSPLATPPKERCDRMEVVTFAAEDGQTGERAMASRQIYREREGAPGRLMPLVFSRGRSGFVIDPRAEAR